MGSCMSKARKIEKQKGEEIALADRDRKGETVKREIRKTELPSDSDSEEVRRHSCNHQGEHLSPIPIPCHSTGVADYKKFATGQYVIDCDQHRNHYFTCPIEPSQQEYYQQRNHPRFYNWHAESTHNAWKNSYRGRGQGALRLNQERSFHTSSPADTYRVPNRSRGYRYEKQRAAEERKARVVPKVTPFLGEGKPTSRQTEENQKNRCEDDETADILRTAAQMFENNNL